MPNTAFRLPEHSTCGLTLDYNGRTHRPYYLFSLNGRRNIDNGAKFRRIRTTCGRIFMRNLVYPKPEREDQTWRCALIFSMTWDILRLITQLWKPHYGGYLKCMEKSWTLWPITISVCGGRHSFLSRQQTSQRTQWKKYNDFRCTQSLWYSRLFFPINLALRTLWWIFEANIIRTDKIRCRGEKAGC